MCIRIVFRIIYILLRNTLIRYDSEKTEMAREGISYNEVAAAADKLVGEGKAPTIKAVREHLGTGSPNTIHRHLASWREAQPAQQSAAYELPSELVNAFGKELARGAAAAKAQVEDDLVNAQSEAADLAAAGERLEIERDELTEQLALVTTERDGFQATAQERGAEIERLVVDLKREAESGEAARVEVAKAQLKAEANAERLTEQAAEIQRLREALETAQAARQEAERNGAVLSAQLEAARERITIAETRESSAVEQALLAQGRADHRAEELQQAIAEGHKAQALLAGAQEALGELKQLKADNRELQQRIDMLLTERAQAKPESPATEA
ncbi:TPA: DNA-binding protein [Pseudomonas putida]|uniref:DNA-binding protein n=1 Tax=Pseudomonas putida TaxID=303 RepID=UPI002363BF42|nr:DNA-binding protein [Pseudomonas putida]HDS1780313.1 DNA-binding protein [Pseudomonas putida]